VIRTNNNFQIDIVPADSTSEDFGTPPFWGSSSDKPLLGSLYLDGGAGAKAQ
jgi:hypothetical protein